MDIRQLQRAIVDGLEDVKAHRIVVFNTEHLSPLFERVIVASGTSNRQTKALAASVRDCVKARGMQVLRTEGEANGEWIIVDCGAAVVHVMQPAVRDYYRLEEIWGGKPVTLKSGEAKASATKTTATRAPRSMAPTVDEPAAKRAGAKKVAAKKSAAKKPATEAKKGALKTASTAKVAAKRAATPRRVAAKTAATPPSKAAPRKAAPRKTPPRKASN
jgi:ribosome-associated protein